LGQFGNIVDLGLGISLVKTSTNTGCTRAGFSLLRFGNGELGSSTAVGVFAGYKLKRNNFSIKLDANLMLINTEFKGFGQTERDEKMRFKTTPGIGYTIGRFGAEADYDLAGDWAGVSLYYVLNK